MLTRKTIEATLAELRALYAFINNPNAETPKATVVCEEDLPKDARALLVHQNHMTIAQQEFHGEPVGVKVLWPVQNGTVYARKSLLFLPSTGRVVQFNIMSIDLDFCTEEMKPEIVAGSIPLGKILIDHNVLRRVSRHGLLCIEPNQEIREVFRLAQTTPVYGRLATIFVNESPAVKLLEVVAPQ